MKPVKRFLILMIGFFLVLNFSSAFTMEAVALLPGGGGNGGSIGSGSSGNLFYPPQFNFTAIQIPSFSIQWPNDTLNIVADIEAIIMAVPDFVAGFFGAVVVDAVLYVFEIIYYFIAYAEYLIVSAAFDAAQGLGIWAIPVFIGLFLIMASFVVMILRILPDVLVVTGG